MAIKMKPNVGCRGSITLLLIALLSGCIGTTAFKIRGGTLELNPRLRGDFNASSGMAEGRFFSDGTCSLQAGSSDECHFISTLRNSLLTGTQLQHLRRANFFWMESDGFPKLSFEVVGRHLDTYEADDPSRVISSQVDVGSCWGFPLLDPENRQAVRGMENAVVANSRETTNQFDVTVRECAAPLAPNAISENLSAVTGNCANSSVQALVANIQPVAHENPPLCVKDLGLNARMMADLSYTLTPGASAGINLADFWQDLSIAPLPITPHLKVVPIDGVRTISRVMQLKSVQDNDDGSKTFRWTWTVPLDGDRWAENFSPNITVAKARVRKGPFGNNNTYLPMKRLDIGRFNCSASRAEGETEFAIQVCEPNMQGGFNVTPTYDAGTFSQAPVDDGLRLLWEAQVRIPANSTLVTQNDTVSLEMDLTAISTIGSSGAGLLADPGGRNLGSVRTGSSGSHSVFVLQNFGVMAAWIDSIVPVGANAAEFGSVQIRRMPSTTTAAATAPAPITPPFFLRGGSSVAVEVTPSFQTAGEKRTDLVVTYKDIRRTPQTLRVAVMANAVSPQINALPPQVSFYLQSSSPAPHLERGALMTNDGGVAVVRQGVSITGPNAADFRVLRAEYGLGNSDLSQQLTMDPGNAEIYRLAFYPLVAGDRHATLNIHTNEGDLSIALFGRCTGDCSQPLPRQAKPKLNEPVLRSPLTTIKLTRRLK